MPGLGPGLSGRKTPQGLLSFTGAQRPPPPGLEAGRGPCSACSPVRREDGRHAHFWGVVRTVEPQDPETRSSDIVIVHVIAITLIIKSS